MLTEIKLQPIFTDINPNTKSVSVAIDTLIMRDGVEVSKERNRCAFTLGDLAGVKAYTGLGDDAPEIVYLNSIWTAEEIAARVEADKVPEPEPQPEEENV